MCKKTLRKSLENYKLNKAKIEIMELKGLEIDKDLESKVKPISIALGALNQKQLKLIEMRYFDNWTQDDIAYDMDISVTTVKRWNKEIFEIMQEILNI